MDELIKFLTADTPIWGYSIHNWLLVISAAIVIWVIVLAKDA
jgi:hypothetical protein